MVYRPTPWDVLELEWCPRYLWFARRLGVPTTPRMLAGKRAEEAARRRLAEALGAEPRPALIDVGWAYGVVDMVARRYAATPVEIKAGPPRREHKAQLLAEAYLVKESGSAVREGVLYYHELNRLMRRAVTPGDIRLGEELLHKAAEVVEGPPPPARPGPRCRYCQYRAVCARY